MIFIRFNKRRVYLGSSKILRCIHINRSPPLPASDPEVQLLRLPQGTVIAYTRDTFTESIDNSRPIMVCVHGTLGSHRDFRYLAGACAQIGHYEKGTSAENDSNTSVFPADLIRVDLPGYGASVASVAGGGDDDDGGGSTDTVHYASIIWQFLDTLYPPTSTGTSTNISERKPRTRKFILLGHSLAGHVVVEMAAHRADDVCGVALLASIGRRPHKGVGGSLFYPAFRRMGGSHLDHPLWGSAMKTLLHMGYVHWGGFSKKSSVADVLHSHRRVAGLDFEAFEKSLAVFSPPLGGGTSPPEEHHNSSSSSSSSGTSASTSRRHSFVAYAENDPHIETSVPRELCAALPPGPRLVFSRGGHNIQKTKSVEIAAALKTWIEGIIAASKLICGSSGAGSCSNCHNDVGESE